MQTSDTLAGQFGGVWREFERVSPGYWVSSTGLVARMRYSTWRLLRGCACGNGYRAITYSDGAQLRRWYIHRAVCELFNGGDGSDLQCRHLNGDMHDNRAVNLAWGTCADNHADKFLHGTDPSGERNPMAKLTDKSVRDMRRLRRETGKPYKEIGPMFGVSTMTAYRAINIQSFKEIA